jgi:hypothetical protein
LGCPGRGLVSAGAVQLVVTFACLVVLLTAARHLARVAERKALMSKATKKQSACLSTVWMILSETIETVWNIGTGSVAAAVTV